MTILKFMLMLPFAIAITLALVGSFILTLHRRRERAFGNSPSIYVPGKVRTVQSPYYDTYTVAAGAQVGGTSGIVTMFGNVNGSNNIAGNITNMTQQFQLAGGESFLMRSLQLVPIGMAEVDLVTFQQNFTSRFIIGTGDYAYCDAPPEFWSAGKGSFTPGTGTSSTNGVPDSRSIFPFDTDPILLTDGTNFRLRLVGTPFTASALFFLRAYLDGQKTQPAQ